MISDRRRTDMPVNDRERSRGQADGAGHRRAGAGPEILSCPRTYRNGRGAAVVEEEADDAGPEGLSVPRRDKGQLASAEPDSARPTLLQHGSRSHRKHGPFERDADSRKPSGAEAAAYSSSSAARLRARPAWPGTGEREE
ncbi:hypothetical protein CDD83_2338 [Cordyceps sp. RAO-2017]|nr:hypothetical protein CDD83_2338 [Cordyceps sp. RAO-2017]